MLYSSAAPPPPLLGSLLGAIVEVIVTIPLQLTIYIVGIVYQLVNGLAVDTSSATSLTVALVSRNASHVPTTFVVFFQNDHLPPEFLKVSSFFEDFSFGP